VEIDYRFSHLKKGLDYDQSLSGDAFDAYMMFWESRILVKEISHLFRSTPFKYLDFACGTGRITHELERFANESIGVDVSESMLAEATKKCVRTKFICEDLTMSNSNIRDVDLITSFRFFGNAQDELRKKALQFMSNTLRKNGYLIINNHRNPNSLRIKAAKLTGYKDEADLTYGKIKALLKEAGFSIERSHAIGWWILRYKWKKYAKNITRTNSFLQQCFGSSIFVPTSPDMLVIAKKC
jgi:SAM-dependent methyltransferase